MSNDTPMKLTVDTKLHIDDPNKLRHRLNAKTDVSPLYDQVNSKNMYIANGVVQAKDSIEINSTAGLDTTNTTKNNQNNHITIDNGTTLNINDSLPSCVSVYNDDENNNNNNNKMGKTFNSNVNVNVKDEDEDEDGFFDQFAFTTIPSNTTSISKKTHSSNSSIDSSSTNKHKHSNSNDSNLITHKRSTSRGSIHDLASNSSKSFFKFFKKNNNNNNNKDPLQSISNNNSPVSPVNSVSSKFQSKRNSIDNRKLSPLITTDDNSSEITLTSNSKKKLSRSSSLLRSRKSTQQQQQQQTPISTQSLQQPKSATFEKLGPVGKLPSPLGKTIPVQTSSAIHFNDNLINKTSTPNLDPPKLPNLFPNPIKQPKIQQPLPKFTPPQQQQQNKIPIKFLPKLPQHKKFILVTSNHKDWKSFDVSQIDSINSFKNLLSLDDNSQIFLTHIGINKDLLGIQLDNDSILKIIEDFKNSNSNLNNNNQLNYKFFIKFSNKLKTKESSDLPFLLEPIDAQLYNTDSHTNSLNSESSIDKFLSTPQYLIQTNKKDSNIDYLNFKDFQDRKPSLTRARSITHSSVTSTPPPLIIHDNLINGGVNGNISGGGGGSGDPITPNKNDFNLSSNRIISSSSNFRLIQPDNRFVDFDNKRATPFANVSTTSSTISTPISKPKPKRNPPPPPINNNINQMSSLSSLPQPSQQQQQQQQPPPPPPPSPGISLVGSISSRNSSKNSSNSIKFNRRGNSVFNVKRSNTSNSIFSVTNNTINVNVDPFTENKIVFKSFSSDEDDNEEDDDSDEGLLANSNFKSIKSTSTIQDQDQDQILDNKNDNNSDNNSDNNNNNNNNYNNNDDDDDDDFVFEEDSNSTMKIIKNSQQDDCQFNSDDSKFNDNINTLPFKKSESIELNIRPAPEVLYNNLEVFFPKTDLDKLIIDDGIQRMKSIRIVAQERIQNKLPILKITNSNGIIPQSSSRLRSGTTGSILRRKSTKMWGQKVIEVHQGEKIETKRDLNGVIEEFAWVKGALIGIGKFGKVFIAMNITTGDLIAVKQMKNENKSFNTEINSLKDLDHINIVQYLGYEISKNQSSIFLEYVSGGSIGHLLRKYGKLNESLIQFLTIQMFQGLNYIHSKGLLHCDLKADNLLLETNGILKISDFGISKRSKELLSSKMVFQGTIFWMAPEIINDKNYDKKVDIWSSGCILIEMFTGNRPWKSFEIEAVLYKLGKENIIPPIPKDIRNLMSSESKNFIKLCLQINPNDRPDAKYLLNDKFCKSLNNNFKFSNTNLAKQMNQDERMESDKLSMRMKSMVKKL